jgi:hypothetical protein
MLNLDTLVPASYNEQKERESESERASKRERERETSIMSSEKCLIVVTRVVVLYTMILAVSKLERLGRRMRAMAPFLKKATPSTSSLSISHIDWFPKRLQLLRCQCLYFCTSKASKLSISTGFRKDCSSSGVSACTFVLVKQVIDWFPKKLQLLRCQCLYFCTSKASKLSTSSRESQK